jgi:hypothetical protein
MAAQYVLYALEALLDQPDHLTRGRDGARSELRATWQCGCVATGQTSSALEVVACPAHAKLFET